ncbi:MAG TPA: SbmA/BacA-like family transporter [Gemmataceae bacterium]|jgi:putative ATP-binding cassette transporter
MLSTIRHAWNRIRTIARPFRHYDGRWWAVAMAGGILALLLLMAWLNVVINRVGGQFWEALDHRDSTGFTREAFTYVGMYVVITLVQTGEYFAELRLVLMLRDGLTRHLIERYLANRTYYRLTTRPEIDNPDQRITEDVKNFTQMAISFLVILLNAILAAVLFTGVLWRIAPRLVAAAVLVAAFGSVATVVVGRRLAGLNFLQLKKEADFRFGLIRTRENGEAIALQGSEAGEEGRLKTRLQALVDNFKHVIAVQRNVQFFTVIYGYLTPVIPLLVIAPLYFDDQVPFGDVARSVGAFVAVVGAFSVIVSQFQQIAQFTAGAERLGALVEVLDAEPLPEPVGKPHVAVAEDGPRVEFDHLTLRTPTDERELVTDLTFQLPPGQRLLVNGQNGAGKTALFQAIDGMWADGDGRIVRPPHGQVMFLPQKPYVAPGKLRDQLLEGAGCKPLPDERIKALLRELRIEKVVVRAGGLDAEKDWMAVLSPGELRLLSFARLVLAQPAFAFLDVGVSGLDDFWVHTLYRTLSKTKTVYVSIGENETLRAYHDVELILAGHGAWAVNEARQVAAG